MPGTGRPDTRDGRGITLRFLVRLLCDIQISSEPAFDRQRMHAAEELLQAGEIGFAFGGDERLAMVFAGVVPAVGDVCGTAGGVANVK